MSRHGVIASPHVTRARPTSRRAGAGEGEGTRWVGGRPRPAARERPGGRAVDGTQAAAPCPRTATGSRTAVKNPTLSARRLLLFLQRKEAQVSSSSPKSKRGPGRPRKLSAAQERELVRRLIETDADVADLALRFGISTSTVYAIARRAS